MFTGIIQCTAEVVAIERKADFQTHYIALPEALLTGLQTGASVAHNGCCLTVTEISDHHVAFDLMQATLKATNLGELQVGDRVNIERAARFGDEIGGHSMSGHIIDTLRVDEVLVTPNNHQIWLRLPISYRKYIFTKGYVGLDGASLTIGEVEAERFCVNLIPETLDRTLLGERKPGDRINLEIDPQTQAIVDTVERVMAERLG